MNAYCHYVGPWIFCYKKFTKKSIEKKSNGEQMMGKNKSSTWCIMWTIDEEQWMIGKIDIFK